MSPTPTPPPPQPGAGRPDRRDLSRTFWRGISSTHGLGPALEAVLREVNPQAGARRTSVWLHDRRARELAVVASSDPSYAATAGRVAVADPDAPAARGLRLEQPQMIVDAADAEPVLISPLRGWRRALGTIVIEGAPDTAIEFAGELGRQVSVGIENVQLLEDMLRQRRLIEDTFNSLLDPVVVTDRAQRVVQMNDAFAIRLGKARADLFEHGLAELVGAELAEWAAATDADGSGDRGTDAGVRMRTIEHPELGGTFAVTVTPLINADGEPVGTVLAARDITRQTRLEAEQEALRARLTQAEKLAALGQFVAGIAHEMNNPLQGVLGHLELLIHAPATSPARPLRPELRRIYTEADRAAKIVRNLLVFTGSQRMARRRLRLDRVLTRALSSRRAALTRQAIDVVRRIPETLPALVGDPLLLQQAFLNVLINAEHAIADTGAPGSIEIAARTKDEGGTIVVTIRDTGGGIPAAVLPRLFDPFFSTKDVGKGTGLGLAITYGILQEHGGTIHAANAPEGGAVFTIELPATD